jgi:hypothetical protein
MVSGVNCGRIVIVVEGPFPSQAFEAGDAPHACHQLDRISLSSRLKRRIHAIAGSIASA